MDFNVPHHFAYYFYNLFTICAYGFYNKKKRNFVLLFGFILTAIRGGNDKEVKKLG